MRENNVFISGDLWKQYLKKKKKVFSRVGTSEKKLFAVEPRKKFSFHVLRWGKKINKINHVSRVSENTVFAAETSKKKIYLYIINIYFYTL